MTPWTSWTSLALFLLSISGWIPSKVVSEIRNFDVEIKANSTVVHYTQGFIMAPGYIDFSNVNFFAEAYNDLFGIGDGDGDGDGNDDDVGEPVIDQNDDMTDGGGRQLRDSVTVSSQAVSIQIPLSTEYIRRCFVSSK